MPSPKPRAAILLGAGSSIPGGFPSTEELTRRILQGTGITHHTDGTFYFSPSGGAASEHVKLVATATNRYRDEIEGFFQQRYGRSANYEDIYYLASQLADHEEGELDNPGLNRLTEHLRPLLTPLVEAAGVPDVATFRELTRETAHYMYDTVWRSLSITPCQTHQLNPIEALCRSVRFERVALATLCHDIHLDDFLKSRDVAFVDGFSQPENGVRYWRSGHLLEPSPEPLLLKLHGSINWFRLRPDGGTWYDERIGIVADGDYWHTQDTQGRSQTPVPNRPLFLVGTFNKLGDYSQQLFSELLNALRVFLSAADRVAVCGYGFGDKGINAVLINWLYGGQHRKLVVIHRDPQGLQAAARGAIANKWNDWRDLRCLSTIEKWIQDLDGDELESCLAG
jgi:hypothetical protein